MTFEIKTPRGTRLVGPGHPVFIIGEMSGNHNLQYDRACELIDIAIAAGVDAVKIQTYTADTLTIDCENDYFQVKVNDAWAGQTLYSLYQKAYTPWEWQPRLIAYAAERGVLMFSTPFDETAVDFLEGLGSPLYKVASFESNHIPLLKRIGRTRKPVIISRGLTSLEDLRLAVDTLTSAGCPQVAVLHCVSAYPADPSQMNLRTIPDIASKLGVIAGLSDHSMGIAIPLAAVALGASIVEKHYTKKRSDGGPDSSFSLEADELKSLVASVRIAEAALGQPSYVADSKERENIVFRRSIFVVRDLAVGEVLTPENIRVIRPGYGLSPKYFDGVLGKRATRAIERGTPLSDELFE